jgi:hypothetical protein
MIPAESRDTRVENNAHFMLDSFAVAAALEHE